MGMPNKIHIIPLETYLDTPDTIDSDLGVMYLWKTVQFFSIASMFILITLQIHFHANLSLPIKGANLAQ